MNIHIFLHLYACMYMGFVPENKLIRIRIHSLYENVWLLEEI